MADQNRRPGRPQGTPEFVRPEVEAIRSRSAATVDEIRGAPRRESEPTGSGRGLLRTVRERPAIALGLLFGAGILLGYLTGGEEEKEPIRGARGEPGAALWERRARRLRRLSREQQAELLRLRLPLDDDPEDDDLELDEEEDFDLDDEDEEEDDDFDLDEDDELEEDEDLDEDEFGLRHEGGVRAIRRPRPSLPAFIRDGMQRMIRRDARSA